MRNKILKLFLAYSYISLVCYVGSESALNMAKAATTGKDGASKADLKIESLWKTTFKRWKETTKLITED